MQRFPPPEEEEDEDALGVTGWSFRTALRGQRERRGNAAFEYATRTVEGARRRRAMAALDAAGGVAPLSPPAPAHEEEEQHDDDDDHDSSGSSGDDDDEQQEQQEQPRPPPPPSLDQWRALWRLQLAASAAEAAAALRSSSPPPLAPPRPPNAAPVAPAPQPPHPHPPPVTPPFYPDAHEAADTTARAVRRGGRDPQGIPWERVPLGRRHYRRQRLAAYRTYTNVLAGGPDAARFGERVTAPPDGGQRWRRKILRECDEAVPVPAAAAAAAAAAGEADGGGAEVAAASSGGGSAPGSAQGDDRDARAAMLEELTNERHPLAVEDDAGNVVGLHRLDGIGWSGDDDSDDDDSDDIDEGGHGRRGDGRVDEARDEARDAWDARWRRRERLRQRRERERRRQVRDEVAAARDGDPGDDDSDGVGITAADHRRRARRARRLERRRAAALAALPRPPPWPLCPRRGPMYDFCRNWRAPRSSIVHFQLRNLVWAPSADSVFLAQESAVAHWRPSARRLRRAVDLRGAPAGPSMPGGVVGRVLVSTVCARHGLVAAGGFAGEVVVVREDGGGLAARRARAAAAAAAASTTTTLGGGSGATAGAREWWRPSYDAGFGGRGDSSCCSSDDDDEEVEEDEAGFETDEEEEEDEAGRRRHHRGRRLLRPKAPAPAPLPSSPAPPAAGAEPAAAAAMRQLHAPALALPFCAATFADAAERARQAALAAGLGVEAATAAAADAAAAAGGWDWWDDAGGNGGYDDNNGSRGWGWDDGEVDEDDDDDDDDDDDEEAAAAAAAAEAEAAAAAARLPPRLLPGRPRPFYLRPGLTPQGGPDAALPPGAGDRRLPREGGGGATLGPLQRAADAAIAAAAPAHAAADRRRPPAPRAAAAAAAARAAALARASLSGRRPDGRPALPRGLVYSGRVTRSDNGITNALEIYPSSSSSLAVAASNNDAFVRVLDAGQGFRERARFAFDYAVNCTAARPSSPPCSPGGRGGAGGDNGLSTSAAPAGHSPVLAVVGDHPEAVLVDERCAGGAAVARFAGHRDYSFAVAWHPGGNLLATGNQDTTTLVWDGRFAGRGPLARLGARMGAVRSCRFSPCGRFLASAEPADFVHLYDVRALAGEAASKGADSAFFRGGGGGGGDAGDAGAAAFRRPQRRRFWAQEIDHFGEVSGIAFSPDSRSLYIGIADATYSSLAHYVLAPGQEDDEDEDGEENGVGGGEGGLGWRSAAQAAEARRARVARRRRCATGLF